MVPPPRHASVLPCRKSRRRPSSSISTSTSATSIAWPLRSPVARSAFSPRQDAQMPDRRPSPDRAGGHRRVLPDDRRGGGDGRGRSTSVLITNQIVSPGKIARLVALAKQAEVIACVDDERTSGTLTWPPAPPAFVCRSWWRSTSGKIVAASSPACRPSRSRNPSPAPNLRFSGLQAYQGKAQHVYELGRGWRSGPVDGSTRLTVEISVPTAWNAPSSAAGGPGLMPSRRTAASITRSRPAPTSSWTPITNGSRADPTSSRACSC